MPHLLQLDDAHAVSIMWLRDMCPCSTCVHPSGQRLLDPAGIPTDLAVDEWHVEGSTLHVRWAPDAHVSEYPLASVVATEPARSPESPSGWGHEAHDALPTATHASIIRPRPDGQSALRGWLEGIDAMGCGLLHGVPIADGEVARVAELFGHVRVTNYGRWFDVRSVVDPTNLAYTSLGLPAHTDNPYRDPVPTMQLLHCLQSSAAGGENVLVDGWHVAEQLRAADPEGFALLAHRAVTFRYVDGDVDLSTTLPIVELDIAHQVRGIRFNARSMQPPRLPVDESAAWYRAYTLFARLLADPANQIHLRLDPGDLFVVDNRRVLHGRTGFAASGGTRHLQGCYADIDGLRSTLAVLQRAASS